MAGDEDWREQRRRAVHAHAEAESRAQAVEQAAAAELVHRFAADATARGLRPERLRVTSYDGRHRYRTGLTGWYVDRARSRAVDTRGNFYLLTVPNSLRALLFGTVCPPVPPPLVVGRGGRDGESLPLAELLDRRLAAGDDWP
ncbi:hypothetical protein [Micromonospora endophytica]|uniref:Uncharacterized protein n=1 Tax=Micromonospora endophytica TaxID=515350 RepID=A0A2W2CRE6_9ACTN|nr:hypothetical protein [Micromonospora endophytica]PZG00491.1 hypothetical protein C1I93_02470 [Micromonospora endophytica]RIW46410.1 hypothetical protein D3H59_12280 [Micromonospora endophytica]BCJ57423.1 hypothetical protein Jiend_08450 [Micromonospora endophytica]